jgi:putative PIG3 family NAD(P)H quinone oxidoreductase
MKAVIITQPGSSEVLQIQDRPTPVIDKQQVLINVKAAGLNRLDIYQRKGNYPPPAGVLEDILGVEVAGVISSVGSNVKSWKIGDRVCALIGGGGYAEYASVEASHCLPIPQNLTFAEAASLPEAIFTVWSNVFWRGHLTAGENFLVHGGSSGIGITAIQLAAAFSANVYATAGSEEKCAACEALGATQCINYKTKDFESELTSAGMDVILDMVGGDYFDKNLNLLNPEGRLVYINAMEGAKVNLNIPKMMRKRATITGSTLRSRESAFKSALAEDIYLKVWPLIDAGKFKPVIAATFPFDQAAEAHLYMESSQHIGKIVLTNNESFESKMLTAEK